MDFIPQKAKGYAVVNPTQAICTRAITDYLLFWPSVGLDVWVFDILSINTISFQTTTHLIIYTHAKESTCVSLKYWSPKRWTCLGILKDMHMFRNKIALPPNEYNCRHVTAMLECCSMLPGTLFQMNWNPIPDNMESEYKITITHLFVKEQVVRVILKEGRHLTTALQIT